MVCELYLSIHILDIHRFPTPLSFFHHSTFYGEREDICLEWSSTLTWQRKTATCTVGVTINAGSRLASDDSVGVFHILERMSFKVCPLLFFSYPSLLSSFTMLIFDIVYKEHCCCRFGKATRGARWDGSCYMYAREYSVLHWLSTGPSWVSMIILFHI